MLREFAVEPTLFAEWEACRFFAATFGVEHGRLIARFPRHWRDIVGESLTRLSPMERSRIVSKLKKLRPCIVDGCRPYSDNLNWLENAEHAHASQPFHAIVASDNPRNHDHVIDYINLDTDHVLFACERTCRMEQTTEGFCNAAGPLLAIASEVIFVEPHFFKRSRKAYDRWTRWTDTFGALVECIQKPLLRLELFTSIAPNEDGSVADLFKEKLPKHIPTGMNLDIHFLNTAIVNSDADTHNRYILTNYGGLVFPWGLDAKVQSAQDTVSLLSASVTNSLLCEYDTFRDHTGLMHVTLSGEKC